MFCPKCSRENLDKNKFCNGCGSSLQPVSTPPVRQSTPIPSPTIEEEFEIHNDYQEVEGVKDEYSPAIIGDFEELDRTSGNADLSMVFEEAESRLDEILLDQPNPHPSVPSITLNDVMSDTGMSPHLLKLSMNSFNTN